MSFSPALTHCLSGQKEKEGGREKKKKKLNGTEYQLGIENYFKEEWGL